MFTVINIVRFIISDSSKTFGEISASSLVGELVDLKIIVFNIDE